MEYILVFDVGTTAVKASLFSKTLSYVGSHVCEYELLTMQDNRVELPANVYVENACEALSGLFSETGVNKEEISSIAITTQGETLIPVDDHGNPLTNAIV
jgi:xylulokinase